MRFEIYEVTEILARYIIFSLFLITAFQAIADENAETPGSNDVVSINQFEKLIITEAVREEMTIRAIRHALNQPLSSDPRDADKYVCQFSSRTGTHLKHLKCGTNSAWAYSPLQDKAFATDGSWGDARGFNGSKDGDYERNNFVGLGNLGRGEVKRLIDQFTGNDSDEINAELLETFLIKQAIGFSKSRNGLVVNDLVNYTRALIQLPAYDEGFKAVYNLNIIRSPTQLTDENMRIRRETIEAQGLTVDEFDGITAEIRSDLEVQSAIKRALDVDF